MSIENFIQNLATGNADAARDALSDALSAKAFESLQDRKVELAQTIFSSQEVESEPEVTTNTNEVA